MRRWKEHRIEVHKESPHSTPAQEGQGHGSSLELTAWSLTVSVPQLSSEPGASRGLSLVLLSGLGQEPYSHGADRKRSREDWRWAEPDLEPTQPPKSSPDPNQVRG